MKSFFIRWVALVTTLLFWGNFTALPLAQAQAYNASKISPLDTRLIQWEFALRKVN
jgi:hypothetical protein